MEERFLFSNYSFNVMPGALLIILIIKFMCSNSSRKTIAIYVQTLGSTHSWYDFRSGICTSHRATSVRGERAGLWLQLCMLTGPTGEIHTSYRELIGAPCSKSTEIRSKGSRASYPEAGVEEMNSELWPWEGMESSPCGPKGPICS